MLSAAWRGARNVARSRLGKAVGTTLRNAAVKTVEGVSRDLLGGPAGSFGSHLSQALAARSAIAGELVPERNDEDSALAGARKFIRIAGSTAVRAAALPQTTTPRRAARAALDAALRDSNTDTIPQRNRSGRGALSGRWVRQGNKIILTGL